MNKTESGGPVRWLSGKVLAAEPDDLSVISESYIVGRDLMLEFFLSFPCVGLGTDTDRHIQTHACTQTHPKTLSVVQFYFLKDTISRSGYGEL